MKILLTYINTIITICSLFPSAVILAQSPDVIKTDYRFVILGCNRVNVNDTVNNPSNANIPQLEQTLREIDTLNPKPKFIFFAGDLIYGFTLDTSLLAYSYKSWIEFYKTTNISKDTNVMLVVIPGNHEMLYKSPGGEIFDTSSPQGISGRIFTNYMREFIRGNNGPVLQTDESMLTYSFNYKNDHFVILNTDTYPDISSIPYDWAENDIVSARKEKNIRSIFLIGHKPAWLPFEPHYRLNLKGINPQFYSLQPDSLRNKFWSLLDENKCIAMFSSHLHAFLPGYKPGKFTWQFYNGDGGSEPIKDMADTLNYFGYSVVSVLTDMNVIVECYGRAVPKPYNSPDVLLPTIIRNKYYIEAGK